MQDVRLMGRYEASSLADLRALSSGMIMALRHSFGQRYSDTEITEIQWADGGRREDQVDPIIRGERDM